MTKFLKHWEKCESFLSVQVTVTSLSLSTSHLCIFKLFIFEMKLWNFQCTHFGVWWQNTFVTNVFFRFPPKARSSTNSMTNHVRQKRFVFTSHRRETSLLIWRKSEFYTNLANFTQETDFSRNLENKLPFCVFFL